MQEDPPKTRMKKMDELLVITYIKGFSWRWGRKGVMK
jgi:hypothetical protein